MDLFEKKLYSLVLKYSTKKLNKKKKINLANILEIIDSYNPNNIPIDWIKYLI